MISFLLWIIRSLIKIEAQKKKRLLKYYCFSSLFFYELFGLAFQPETKHCRRQQHDEK